MTCRETVERYVAAWNATDEGTRRRLLEQSWTEDGAYTDPTTYVAGREALVAHIGAFQRRMPGARFDLIAGPEEHHHFLRFLWRLTADGSAPREGMDVGDLAEDGRLFGVLDLTDELAGSRVVLAPVAVGESPVRSTSGGVRADGPLHTLGCLCAGPLVNGGIDD